MPKATTTTQEAQAVKTPEDIKSEMDTAAAEAREELVILMKADADALALINWWKKWYPKAGHKRLGRTLAKWGK